LVAAFRSTLEETKLSDCLLVVSDATAVNRVPQEAAVRTILEELEAQDVPRLRLFNKCDLLEPRARKELENANPDAILVSGATGEGIPEALERLQRVLAKRWLLRELEVPHARAHESAEIRACAQVLSVTHSGDTARYRLRVTPENWDRIKSKLN